MQMAVDEPRRYHRMPAVNLALAGVALGHLRRLADRDDLAAVDRNRGIADDAAAGIDGDQPVDIGNHQVDTLHADLAYLLPSPT